MSALIPADFGQVSTKFANTAGNDELSSGIQSSFGLVGYKGKVWSIRYRGDETQLMRDDGDGPRGSVEVVVIKASSQISKIWYENGYVEGSNAAPDCFSNNGVTPEATSLKKQCDNCATCPMNQWGSRITPQGKQGKACSDSKRLAVVPLQDIDNEVYGGPMLLRVPAASLNDVAMFGQKMQQMGYPYFGIGTRIGFDPAESFPKFTFGAIRVLSDAEADKVLALRDSHQVNRILSESEFGAPAAASPAQQEPVFEQPPVTTQVTQQASQPVETDAERELRELKAQLAAKQAAAQPVEQKPEETPAERELRELKEQLAAKQASEKAAQEAAAVAAANKKAEAEAKKAAKAKAEAEAAAQRELEALKAAANQPVETDAERELRELKAQLAAQGDVTTTGNVGNGAVSTAAAPQPTETAPALEQASTATASPSNTGVATPSDFENNLDSLLNDLLP